ncbi:glycerate kinase [Tsukamurella serpentis]
MTADPTTVLLAPDKFKGSLSAAAVTDALARGIADVAPDWLCVRAPIADGGEGTVDAAVSAGWDRVHVVTTGPTGEVHRTGYARRGDEAVVELASSVGLGLLPGGRFAPLQAGTAGLGTVIAHALDHGAREIVIGLGGSASTDGGAGMLTALGAEITDADGRPVAPGGGGLLQATRLDLSGLHRAARSARFTLACDVDNPLLGADGAAAVYGPQKGVDPADIPVLDDALRTWADLVRATTGRDLRAAAGAGAAGGAGFGAMSLLGARARPGVEIVLELTDFAVKLASCDLVITGEGSLDEQTLHGKAPAGVAAAARERGVPVLAVAGRSTLDADQIHRAGFRRAIALSALEPDPQRCMTDAAALLRTVGRSIASGCAGRRA